jgi:MtN3 and saliva related transmembrane protein
MPQAFKIIKTRDTKAISLSMYVVMTTGTLSWFIYGVLIGDVPLMLANGITSIFTIAILVMKIRYR